jgi:hypothetical protein
MLSKRRPRITYANVISTLCLFMLLGGGAWAATNFVGPNGQIRGCVGTKGRLTVIKSGGHCKTGLSQIAWNQRGRRGTRGLQGIPGRPGGTGAGVGALYGDGSDGDATISTSTTLTRDTYYRNLTISSQLDPGGFRLFVSGTLTFRNGSSITREGGLSGQTSGTLGGSGSGGGAGTQPNSLGGDGGGGVGATPPSVAAGGAGVFHSALAAITGRSLDGTIVRGGAGGNGVFGGSGGGVIVVAARNVAVTGSASIEANGYVGCCDSTADGGGGGVVVVISTSAQPAGLALSAQGGKAVSGGANGSAGTTAWLK